jgi:hypothetical protein
LVLFAELLESLEIFALLKILEPDIADQSPYPIDVIGQAHHTEYLYEDEANSLLIGCWEDVSKPHC